VGKKSIIQDFSNLLGQMFFSINAISYNNTSSILNLINGSLVQGVWIVLNNCDKLGHNTLSLISQLLGDVKAARDGKKE